MHCTSHQIKKISSEVLELFTLHAFSGVNRYFQMALLADKLKSATGKRVSSDQIWEHLGEMYDLNALVSSYLFFIHWVVHSHLTALYLLPSSNSGSVLILTS